MADWNGFKKNGTTYIPNDATARERISAIEGKIPSAASSSNKLVDTSTLTTELNGKVNVSSVGANNGVAGLDANGRVPSSQLPSYVDDVLEYASQSAFPATGETGKIYIALDTNKTYRWSGSAYVEISESLALGETASSAYAGNKGKANADAIAAIKDGSSIDSFGDVETALAGKVDKIEGKGLSTNDYDNTAKGIVDNIQSNVIANTKLIKDTVGWSRKNLLDNDLTNTFPVIEKNGVTFSIQKDNSIIVNGTATANITDYFIKTYLSLKAGKYICTGNPEGTTGFVTGLRISDPSYATVNYFFEGGFELTLNSDIDELRVDIRVGSGATFNNVIFKPMIRSAYILDDTYEPYFGSTAFPRSEQAVTGAVNLLQNKGVNKEENGLVFTFSSDGTVVVNGTATATTGCSINASTIVKNGWKIVGCPSGGGADTFEMQVYKSVSPYTSYAVDRGNGAIISADDIASVNIVIRNGYHADNLIFKPMITLDLNATYADYVPYAMTNRELTDVVVPVDITSEFMTLEEGISLGSDVSVVKIGKLIVGNLIFKKTGNFTQGQATIIATVDSKYRPKKNLNSVCHFTTSEWDGSQPISGYLWVGTNGAINIRQYSETAQIACKMSFSYAIS